jgi:hypothetical protein
VRDVPAMATYWFLKIGDHRHRAGLTTVGEREGFRKPLFMSFEKELGAKAATTFGARLRT